MPFGETFIVINLVACSERVRLSESAGVCVCRGVLTQAWVRRICSRKPCKLSNRRARYRSAPAPPATRHPQEQQKCVETGKKKISMRLIYKAFPPPSCHENLYFFVLFKSIQDLPEWGAIKRDLIGFSYCRFKEAISFILSNSPQLCLFLSCTINWGLSPLESAAILKEDHSNE